MLVEELQEELAYLYTTYRQRVNPRYVLVDKDQVHIRRSAQMCKALGLPADEFFQALQDFPLNKRLGTLYVTCLYPEGLSKWLAENKQALPPVRDFIMAYNAILKAQLVNRKRDLTTTLMDESLDLPAWYRCSITKEPIPTVMQRWAVAAREQLTQEIVDEAASMGIDVSRLNDE